MYTHTPFLKFPQDFMQYSFFLAVKDGPRHALLHDLYFDYVYVYMYILKMHVCIVRCKKCTF